MDTPLHSHYLKPENVSDWPISPRPVKGADLKAPLKKAIAENHLDHPLQIAGTHFAIGCVALEITQRCNLDCTACYLSDYSEAVRDLPIEEVFRRIDLIALHYGPNTNVQVTGGDPTLRNRDELVRIIAYLAEKNLRPALFTNGIKASRELLITLQAAGLKDVAFHVDMTQERKGYNSEEELNTIREDYIEKARGTGLQIIFNTTVYSGNLKDIPMLSHFFCHRAKDVHLASFQMIADTGRGVERERGDAITQQGVMDLINEGAGVTLGFDFPQIGHLECNRYAKCLVAGKARVSAFNEQDRAFFSHLLPFASTLFLSRHRPLSSLMHLAGRLLSGNLRLFGGIIAYGVRKGWALKKGLWAVRGKPDMITFYIHNFMHAHELKQDRCKACVFMTMTRDGPVSMCIHNAKRDAFILQDVTTSNGEKWQPLIRETNHTIQSLPIKRLKGRERVARKTVSIEGTIGAIATKRRKEAERFEKAE